MKKFKLIVLLSAFVVIASMSCVCGASTPVFDTGASKPMFFANGTPITIEAIPGDDTAAKIVWDGGSQIVGSTTTVFGGCHNNATPTTSSITMNGGVIKNIFGGGLHESNTTSATVIINGGTVNSICGGGSNGFISDSCTRYNDPTDCLHSTCQTGTVNITINNGKIKTSVFGGGEDYSNTDKVYLTVKGGDLSTAWLVAGGSNGNTTNAYVDITGGKFNVVQSVNRGTMSLVDVVVSGGTIKNLYIGGETEDTSVNGTVSSSIKLKVIDNAVVENLKLGTNGGIEIDLEDIGSVVKKEDVVVLPTTIENMTIGENITKIWKVTIDKTEFIVEEGKTIKDIKEYSKLIYKEGYEFGGFIAGGKAYDPASKITSNIVLETVFKKKDTTPKTGGVDIAMCVGIVGLVMGVTGITLTKKKYSE